MHIKHGANQMGYDEERERSRQRQSRARQPKKAAEGRRIDYKIGEEPGKNEPGLDLITDHFKREQIKKETVSVKNAAPHRAVGKKETGKKEALKRTSLKKEDIFRDPAKRKKEERLGRKRNKKRKRRILIILVELLILLSVLVFAGYSYLTSHLDLMTKLPWDPDKIKNEEISLEKQEQMEGYWTIAVFGLDSRNSSLGSGNNADVNIICNVDQGTGEIKLVSVYRDTYLNVSEKNSYQKINSAYLRGGPEQAVMALNKNLDLDIDEYVTFNWKAVADAINILGGIDLEISKAEFYYINAFITETVQATGVASSHLKQAGMNHLDGVQAVAYGRLRLMDSDYARTERQRKVISLAFEKMKEADWATVNNIIQTVFPQVSTSVDIHDLLTMGRILPRYHLTETMGFPSERKEVRMGRKGACVIPYTLESNVIELHRFLFGDELYEPTSLVCSISQKILADIGKPQETAAVTKTEAKETKTSVQTEQTEMTPEPIETILEQTETIPEPEDSEEEDKLPIDGETEAREESDSKEAETETAESKEAERGSEKAEEMKTPETVLTGPTADASLTETEPLSPDKEKVHTDTGLILYPGSQISSEEE